ncbi:MAG: TIGR00725 family protein [Cenarchaeum sp. SB0665_bin_23]|nr:TIGR00725 family protein [Cenarchaeum sp. SB0667_bin_13]MXY61544.1 TIGR00725 family protein [Cenarchaeum sp. SB0665_bin_23]MXZ93801.1 TIGR00725 family protein [Cenarchaeum sp. SB0666_bin_15]MYB46978.1 TIGR00725 family protein [Cenarchaeum sp. SB0662_bin_33]MYC80263.1 TIGR00725 family protein [Cenarchaeum sp. SB0661_bin_35]MYD58795.1 TIGR00725 family protein [Cenarchaeum sp. SB0678_bin_8]MYG33266.1 TIGR00725 family protein [Cenarchaeum sp. SB0677_bin_16]
MKKTQILVIGHNDNGFLPLHEKISYEVGYLIAKRGAVLLTGGMGGVMRVASCGAKDANGIVVGIIPPKDASAANDFCDIVIPTGLGLMRDFVNAYAADGIIIIGGGVGTLSEMCAAYMHNKPMVAIRNSGGMAERYADKYLDHRKHIIVAGADSPSESVDMLFRILGECS